jgi:hypothetical protein
MKPFFFSLLLLCAALMAGCQAAHEPGGTSHAVVQVSGHSLEKIQQTTAVVFGEEGYSLAMSSPDAMIFDRAGSRRDAAKYGGWSGEGVTMRVRVDFTELAGGSYRLQADVSTVQNSDDPFFRDENRAMMLNRSQYRRMLGEVEKRLAASVPAAP